MRKNKQKETNIAHALANAAGEAHDLRAVLGGVAAFLAGYSRFEDTDLDDPRRRELNVMVDVVIQSLRSACDDSAAEWLYVVAQMVGVVGDQVRFEIHDEPGAIQPEEMPKEKVH